MAKKQRTLTDREQQVAVDILEELIGENVAVKSDFYDKIMNRYHLMRDPFTGFPCTSKEYAKSSLEYSKQCMFERYGHCDGLE